MITTVTKDEFERSLPVGTSAQDNVYEMVLPEIEGQIAFLSNNLLGPEGIKTIESAGEDSILHKKFVSLASTSAFLSVFRQLDLVLTPTGFGVVSNDNVSPASKQRVDALEQQLKVKLLVDKAHVLNSLRSKEWGETIQAKRNIPTLFDEYEFFIMRRVNGLTAEEWLKLQQPIMDADMFLRRKISDKQMDVLMAYYRTNNVDEMGKHADALLAIRNFFHVWLFTGQREAVAFPLRKLLSILESSKNIDLYDEYLNSEAYKVNHHEVFHNTKDSTAFFFNG